MYFYIFDWSFLLFCLGSFFFFKQKTAYEMRISDWSSDVCSSDLLGRGDDRGDLLLLPAATQASQAHEKHQHARTLQWGNPAANLCRADIPQRPQLPAPGPRTRRRNPRKLARSQPLPQYGRTARAEENRTTRPEEREVGKEG